MKKFYYSKETSQDESSNIFSMERRDTIDINNEHGRGMSARAASVNSLDLMSEAPTIPRVQTRDMTRSMSDATTRSQSQKQKLVTETELSSSWLYKTMQASINARFKSPRKSPSVHKSGDLEQSILQDPELEPIPMKSKAKKTSCICHFATMIAISLCSIGFLASIAAIIYMEIFADRNITSLHTPEVEVDLSDVVRDSLEIYNLTAHTDEGEEHILSEARTHRFDGDEKILNEAIKASSPYDIPSLSNKSVSKGLSTDYVTDVGNPKTELNPYIHDDTNSKIKFQDGVTVIYEVKQESIKDDVDSKFSDKFKGRSFGFVTEENSKDNFEKSAESVENSLKQESDVYTEYDRTMQNDTLFLDNTEVTDKVNDFTLNKNPLEDMKETVSEVELKSVAENIKVDNLEKNESADQVSHHVSLPSEKPKSSEIFQAQNIEYEKTSDLDINNVLVGGAEKDHTNKSDTYNNNQLAENSDVVLTNLSDFQSVEYKEVFRSTSEIYDTVADDHDVNTMLVTIDDTEVSTDSFLSKRNGDIGRFPVSSPVPSVEPITQINNSSVSPKKPVDMKVSLADAMKHLQKLDVDNKLLTSRTKPKQKVNVQKPKQKAAFSFAEERKLYLQRMRQMLFKYLQ